MRWQLRSDTFTWHDRIKLASLFLNPRRKWTQGEEVAAYEKEMSTYTKSDALFVSSGSTANTLLAMYTKENCGDRNVVVFPAVTWPTSCSPWIREGFTPHFIDITRTDFSMNIEYLKEFLKHNHSKVACVFVTSVLGFVPDIEALEDVLIRFNVPVMMDNCESSMSLYRGENISKYFTSTISTYFSHHFQSIEGGFVLTHDRSLNYWCKMARNHGMVRSLGDDLGARLFQNGEVDPRFDFFCLGNNFRNTDINALAGRLDMARADAYKESRIHTYRLFRDRIDRVKYYLPQDRDGCTDVPFAIPILRNNDWVSKREELVSLLDELGIENRPIISGNLLKHTAFRKYANSKYPTADHIHGGLYIGIGPNIPDAWVHTLADTLNSI